MCIVSAVDNAEVFRFDQIPRNPQIGIEVLLRGIVNIAPQYGDTVREIRSSPNSHMNQLPMCAQDAFFDFLIDFGRAVNNNRCLLVHKSCILFCQYPRAVL